MRALSLLLPLLLGACEAMEQAVQDIPDWSGPPVRASWQPDGSIAVVLTAPTASHTLDLAGVTVQGDTAEVRLDHQSPGNAYVAQVVTDVTAVVPAERLGETRRARILVATRARGAATEPPPRPLLAAVVDRR